MTLPVHRIPRRRRYSVLTWFALVAATAAVLQAGCIRRAELLPASDAQQPSDVEQAATSVIGGVEVIAQGGAWPGNEEITQDMTPVRIIINNDGPTPVRLRYSDFALIGPDGTRYAALPPFVVEGPMAEPRLSAGYPVLAEPAFEATGFHVAPYYKPVYTGLEVVPYPFPHDPYYHRFYQQHWNDFPLPTLEMYDRALPEGVLDPGGYLDGFMYFEPVDPEQSGVRFRADLVNPVTGRIRGEVSLPFDIRPETLLSEPDPHSRY